METLLLHHAADECIDECVALVATVRDHAEDDHMHARGEHADLVVLPSNACVDLAVCAHLLRVEAGGIVAA
jgi:hypothetical protein